MKTKKIVLAYVILMSFLGCSLKPKSSERFPAFSQKKNDLGEDCYRNFAEAGNRLLQFVEKSPERFSLVLTGGLKQALTEVKIICISQQIGGYGARAHVREKKIEIENQFGSLDDLFYSEKGITAVKKYGIELRAITYDKILIAIAAQSYTDVLSGGVDEENDTFFKTLGFLGQ